MSKTATARRKHFDAIVQQAEEDFRNNPRSYKKKLKRLAWLGYGYLCFILTVCLGFLGGLTYLSIQSPVFFLFLVKSKIIIAVGLVVFVMVRSLLIKIPAPSGIRLSQQQCPDLFAALEDMRKTLNTPKIHEIIITPELNAAIQQTPRLGIFGWQKNSLILGSELLLSLNTQQTMAVLAHEMGHLSGGHAQFNGWIYRLRMSWMNILHTVAHVNAVARWVFGKFFAWYAPYFNAYSFALARANEYEADQIAAEVTSAEDLASALVGVEVVGNLFFSHYWTQLEQQALADPTLKPRNYSDMQAALQDFTFEASAVTREITTAMKRKTNNDDTHPALQDRLSALGCEAKFEFAADESAAVVWFGAGYAEVMTATAVHWVAWNRDRWEALYHQGQQAQQRLAELDGLDELDKEALVEKGQIQMLLQGQQAALKTFRQVLRMDNDEPNALYHLGVALLESGNDKGLQLLEKLMDQSAYVDAAGQQLFAYYAANDMPKQAEQVRLRLEQNFDLEDAFYEELSNTHIDDEFIPVTMDAAAKQRLADSIKKYRAIRHVWLCGKKLHSKPETPVYVLLFELHEEEDEASAFGEQEHPIDVDGYFSFINMEQKRLVKKIRPHCVQLY